MLLLLTKIDRLIGWLEDFLLCTILLAMLFFAFLQVVLRNVYDSGVPWGDVFNRHLVLWLGFLGASRATHLDRHISIDALSKILPKRSKTLVTLLLYSFAIIIACLLTKAGYSFVLSEKAAETILFLHVPTWTLQVIIPIGFGLIAFRYFVKLVAQLYLFAGVKPQETGKKHATPHVEMELKIKI